MITLVDYLIVLDDIENPFLKIVVVTITDFHAPVEADLCAFLCRVVMSTHRDHDVSYSAHAQCID